jgi:hypothetical protein
MIAIGVLIHGLNPVTCAGMKRGSEMTTAKMLPNGCLSSWETAIGYMNANGNPAISKQVLKEFRALTDGTLVWERGERAWRPAKPHEEGKRGVE